MAISQNYPSVTPSLNLDFAKSKFLDPRITFTRASVGTYIGADGLVKSAGSGVARFTHNPLTGQSLGLLIEQSVTNTLTYSEQMNDASWGKSNVTITSNAAVAPDGTTTADRLVITSTSPTLDTRYCFGKGNGIGGGNPVTLSVFVKKDTARYFNMGFHNYGGYTAYVNFDLDLGTYTITGVHPFYVSSSAAIEAFPNNWYRVSFSVGSDQGGNISFFASSNSAIVPTDGTSGVFLWGAQCEQLTFPTTYIPTVASSVTRAADTVSISGTNFSSWYSQDKGTILYSYRTIDTEPSAYSVLWELRNSGTRRLFGYHNNSSYGTFSPSGGGVIGGYSTPSTYVLNKAASAYSSTTVTSTANGANPGTGSYTLTAAQDSILFGSGTDSSQTHCVSNIVYYPVVLTSNQIQTLTK